MGFSADFDFHVGLSKPFQTEIERLWLLGWRCSNTDKKYVNFCQLVTSFPGYKRVTRSRWPDLLEHQRPWTTCSQNSLWWKWCPAAGEVWVCEWWQFPHPMLPLQPFGSYWERDGTGQLITGSWVFEWVFLVPEAGSNHWPASESWSAVHIKQCLVPSSRSRRHAGFGVSSEQTFEGHLEWFVTLTAEGSGWHPLVWCIYLWYIHVYSGWYMGNPPNPESIHSCPNGRNGRWPLKIGVFHGIRLLQDGPRLETRAPPCFISCGETTAMCSQMSIEMPFDWMRLILAIPNH